MATVARMQERNQIFQKEFNGISNNSRLKFCINLRKRNRLSMINSKRSPESAKKLIISDIPTQYRKLAGDLINSASLSIKDQVNHIEDLLVKSNIFYSVLTFLWIYYNYL